MFRRYVQREKANVSPTLPFSHDSKVISFRLWTTLLQREGQLPEDVRRDGAVLFLDERSESCGPERVTVRVPARLINPTQFSHLHVTIVCAATGRIVFSAEELPAGKFLHLAFLQEGGYTLHYSPAFSQSTLRRNVRVVAPAPPVSRIAPNFHPSLEPKGW